MDINYNIIKIKVKECTSYHACNTKKYKYLKLIIITQNRKLNKILKDNKKIIFKYKNIYLEYGKNEESLNKISCKECYFNKLRNNDRVCDICQDYFLRTNKKFFSRNGIFKEFPEYILKFSKINF